MPLYRLQAQPRLSSPPLHRRRDARPNPSFHPQRDLLSNVNGKSPTPHRVRNILNIPRRTTPTSQRPHQPKPNRKIRPSLPRSLPRSRPPQPAVPKTVAARPQPAAPHNLRRPAPAGGPPQNRSRPAPAGGTPQSHPPGPSRRSPPKPHPSYEDHRSQRLSASTPPRNPFHLAKPVLVGHVDNPSPADHPHYIRTASIIPAIRCNTFEKT